VLLKGNLLEIEVSCFNISTELEQNVWYRSCSAEPVFARSPLSKPENHVKIIYKKKSLHEVSITRRLADCSNTVPFVLFSNFWTVLCSIQIVLFFVECHRIPI
jgi:hypothetical protein